MFPALHLRLGPWHLVLSLYAILMAVGVVVGLALSLRRARHPDVVLLVAPLAVAAGVLGAEGWHQVVHSSPGLSSMGGIALGLGVLWVLCRLLGHDSLELLDALAPGAMLAFGVGRIGCWLAGCCHGVVTSLPWGMPIGELGGPPRHPVQLYEAAANTLLACWALRRQRPRGATSAGTMIGYGMIRLMLEPWRDPAGIDRIAAEAPSVTQLGALVLVAAGAILRRIPLDKPAPPVGS